MPQAKVREQEKTPDDASVNDQDAVKVEVEADETKRHNEAFVNALTRMSDESFRRIWDNPRDAEYDDL